VSNIISDGECVDVCSCSPAVNYATVPYWFGDT